MLRLTRPLFDSSTRSSAGSSISKKIREYFDKIDRLKGKPNPALIQRRPAVSQQPIANKRSIPNVKRIIAVSSGKGGVGKSTVSVNLALAFAALGKRTALLDADLFGPSIPRMMNLAQAPAPESVKVAVQAGTSGNDEKKNIEMLRPLDNYGIQCMSMGFLIGDESAPVVWRGLMVMKALQQLLFEVRWDPCDIMVIDMPPGTGDTQLTIGQQVKLDGALIVTTPQDIALVDVRKGYNMFRKINVPLLGLVENMSYFQCPNCQHETHIFGHRRSQLSDEVGKEIETIGQLPLSANICEQMDTGKPTMIMDPAGLHGREYLRIAETILKKLDSA